MCSSRSKKHKYPESIKKNVLNTQTSVDFMGLVFIIIAFKLYPCGIKHDD